MNLQTGIALAAVAGAVVYFIRSTAAEFQGSGKCASGCGSCGSKTCPAKHLKVPAKAHNKAL